MRNDSTPPTFAALIQAFFSEYLTQQRALSPRTVAAYRDTFVLFLDFAEKRLHKPPTVMTLADLAPSLILAFLDHLEKQRHNAIRSRNARLSALRAFLKFAGRRDVSSLYVVEQGLGVPMKRFEQPMLGFLSREEMLAVIGEPGDDWLSQRDHLMMTMLYNTGARVSEIIGVHVADVVLDGTACVHLHGKGRKQRTVPLWRSSVKVVRAWLRRNPQLQPASPLLPNRQGNTMTRANVYRRFQLRIQKVSSEFPMMAHRALSPHTIRHTTAMHMLQSGIDITVIAMWLGHTNPATTHQYVEADLAMKCRALARLDEPPATLRRYRAPDTLMTFLQTL